MIHVGIDWAEAHHDVCILDDDGNLLDRFRISNDLAGVTELHARLAAHADEPGDVIIGLETDRGLLVHALKAAGYRLYAINPMSVDRYRDRHTTSGAKSDRGDAKVLADLVRTDRHNHRPVAGDSELLEAIKVLARTHQDLVWARQRHTNQLRNALLEFFPAAVEIFDDLAHMDAVAVLAAAPTPGQAAALSVDELEQVLRDGARQRFHRRRAEEIHAGLQGERLTAPELIDDALGVRVAALVGLIDTLNRQIDQVEARLVQRFEQHPDADLITSIPGLAAVLGARILGEFGDDPNRYDDAKARANYAGTSPITIASGNREVAVARFKRNRRLADACHRWAVCSLSASPGARAYYDAHNPDPQRTAKHAQRKQANKLVKILHGVLRHRRPYDEQIAWRNWLPDNNIAAAA